MRDLDDAPRAALRPLERAEIDRRLSATLHDLIASRAAGGAGRPVPIAAAELVRLAAPLVSRN